MVSAVSHYPLSRVLRGLDEYFPLLTPLTFLWARLPPVARLNARSPQGRLLLQGYTLDRSGAFRSDGVHALHCLAAHCYARRLTQSKFRA